MERGMIIEQGIPAIPWEVTREESQGKSRKEEINTQMEKSVKMVSAVVGLLMGSGFTTPTEQTLNKYPTAGLY